MRKKLCPNAEVFVYGYEHGYVPYSINTIVQDYDYDFLRNIQKI